MAYLTRDDVLSANDLPTKEVKVPEWGGIVLVRGLSGAEKDRLEASMLRQKGNEISLSINNVRAKLVSMSVIDESGKLVFSEKDVHALGKKSSLALDRVYDVCQRLSGLSAKDVKEIALNLVQTPNDDS